MRISSYCLYYFAIILNFVVLFQSAEGVQRVSDWDRTIITYDAETDPCRHLNAFSHEEERAAADWACKEAFHALDRINGNACSGWRRPKCRFSHDFFSRLCSCKISTCHLIGINCHETKFFRECAVNFRTHEYYVGKVVPSPWFQGISAIIEGEALQAARARSQPTFHAGIPSGEGTSYTANTSNMGVTAVVATPQQAAGTPSFNNGVGVKTFECTDCNNVYLSATSLRDHRKSHTQDLQCKVCQRKYSSRTSYLKHTKSAHRKKNEEGATVTEGAGGKIYGCNACDRVYNSLNAFRDHKKSHTENLHCKACKKKYHAKTSYQKHVQFVHQGDEAATQVETSLKGKEAPSTSRPYVCDVCGKEYAWPKTLASHRKSHTSQSTTCTHCDRTFASPSAYKVHMKGQHK